MTHPWTRRTLLRATLGAGLSATLRFPFDCLAAAAPPLSPTAAPKRVVVLGAGLAGLAAAFELDAAGHDVTVLEARSRPGGRVFTIREPFADGLYAEAGATRIASTNDWTMKYVKHFGLDLVPFRESGLADVYHIRGKRLVVKDGTEPEWPLPLSDEERAIGLTGMREKYISAILPQIGDAGIPDAPPPTLRSFDHVTYSEWLRQRGASKGALELFRLGASGDVSALQSLRSLTWRTGATWWRIAGGNDRLPRAFAEKLASRIHYGSPVRRIRHDSVSVTVTYDRAGVATDLRADHAICTIPFPVLKMLEIEPLSDSKRRAISELHYPNATKIAIQTRTQFWRAEGLSGFAQADLPLPEIWNLSHGPGAQRGMLVGYVAGVHAKMPELATDQERLVWALPYFAQMFPGMEKEFESGKSYSWQEDPWAMGAFPVYGPTQVIDLFPAVRESQGRLHFAGDHASVWPAWMQGALESGNRAARVVNAAMS